MQGVLFKNILLADLLGSKHLFEILQTSLTFKNSGNFINSEYFINLLQWREPIFSHMMEGYKVSCVKILLI